MTNGNSNTQRHGSARPGLRSKRAAAFTLIELLTVVAVISILAAILLPSLAAAKKTAQSTACKGRLRQMGLALHMYASEANHYPSLAERAQTGNVRSNNQTWADAIYPYYPVRWTNQNFHCPGYIARNGIIIPEPPMLDVFTSYSYNDRGIAGEGGAGPKTLGLGSHPATSAPDSQVVAPSEMYAVADSRWWIYGNPQGSIAGKWNMSPWKYEYQMSDGRTVVHVETAPPHGPGYNMLFIDGHVTLVKRNDYLFPPRTARNWNRDNQPHPEAWASTNYWVVEQ